MRVIVVGTGDKAHGLANMYESNAKRGSVDLVFTEPIPTKSYAPFNQYVSVEPYPEALERADIVILAIPAYALENFLVRNFSLVKDNNITLVDLTNEDASKKDLKATMVALGIQYDRWVKAFNDTGAMEEMQFQVSDKKSLRTKVCGPNEESVLQVIEFAKLLGFSPKEIPFDQYSKMRGHQDTIGWEWKHASALMMALFLLIFTYVTIQVSGRPNFQWYTLLGRHSSKMFAWTAVWGFSLSLLPGTTIRLIKIFKASFVPPRVLIWGCQIRKHVGLLSLYFLSLHACMMVLLFGGEYFGFLLREGHMEWNDEASMLCAVLSTSLFTINGIASLPSVSQAMNKAQFAFVFGPVVWSALALGTMHIMFLGVPSWSYPRSPYSWARDMPPITLMASVVPLFVLSIKFVQLILARIFLLKHMLDARHRVASAHASSLGHVDADEEV